MFGRRGRLRGCIPACCASLPPLRRLQGEHAVTMFSHVVRPPLERGDDVIERQILMACRNTGTRSHRAGTR